MGKTEKIENERKRFLKGGNWKGGKVEMDRMAGFCAIRAQ